MKKLKLKKKVKVITTLLSFGMLLTVLPSMKLVAEDDTTTDTSDVIAGPYIKYDSTEDYYSDEVYNDSDFTTLEANGGIAVATDGSTTNPVVNTDDNDSLTYDKKITVNKTISTVDGLDDVYKLTMSAKSNPNSVNPGVDIVLMLDMSDHMTTSSVTELKKAVNSFIEKINGIADNSRIAIVKYSGNAEVLSGTKKPEDGALVTVKNNVNTLETLVNNIGTSGSDNSNCDQAMLKAVQIFQSANNNNTADGNLNGGTYATRTRVSVLFTAGIPGEGNEDKDSSGWSYDARERAQAAMSLATILKGNKKVPIIPSDDSAVAGGKNWGKIKDNYINKNGATYAGCGSTVYAVGLNLPHSSIDTDGYLSIQEKQSALVNEYLYRVSSHRKLGLHYTFDQAKENDPLFYNTFNSLSQTVKNEYNGNSMDYFYPDSLTRNRTDAYVDGSYFLTTDNSSELTSFFNKIASQAGENFKNLQVKDYIDSAFIPVDSQGNPYSESDLTNGVDIVASNGTGKLYYTVKDGYYVIWSNVELSYETSGNGKSFEESIYVKPVDGFMGGTNLVTNKNESGVYKEDGTGYAFPQPSVDIPINYSMEISDHNIYLTNSVDLADLISNKPDGITNKGVKVTYTFTNTKGDFVKTLTYEAGSNQGIWSDDFSGTVGFDDGLTRDQEYEISCTVESINKTEDNLTESTSHHIHAEVNDQTVSNTCNVNVFKPELKYHDLHIYYGDSKPDYSSALSNTSWKHGDTLDNDVTMNGSAPGLNIIYFDSPDESGYSAIVFPTKNDYQVGVNVFVGENNITENSTFVRSTDDECKDIDKSKHSEDLDTENKKQFIVHIDKCSLKVTKSGGSADETYVFDIMKDGTKYSEVSITGNDSIILSELPVGTYSIVEDTDLSWRYKSDGTEQHLGPIYSGNETLSSNHTSGEITCTNTKSNDKWLSKVTSAVQNVFGGEEHHSSKPHSTN